MHSFKEEPRWTLFAKKQRGRFCIHGLYELIKAYKDTPFFSRYKISLNQSNLTKRKYIMIHLRNKGTIKRHVSIDQVFTNTDVRLAPYHLTRTEEFLKYKRVEHAYIEFNAIEAGRFKCFVTHIEAYELQNDSTQTEEDSVYYETEAINSMRKRIELSPDELDNIRHEVETDVDIILQNIHQFKTQYIYELGEKLADIENSLSKLWENSQNLTKAALEKIKLLTIQKMNILNEIHLFSNTTLRQRKENNTLNQCLQAPFLLAIIAMLDKRLAEKIKKETVISEQNTEHTMSSQSAPTSSGFSKKTNKKSSLAKSKNTSLHPHTIRNALEDIIRRIDGCNEEDLRILNGDSLILYSVHETLIINDPQLRELNLACEMALKQRTADFDKAITVVQTRIDRLKGLLQNIQEQNDCYLAEIDSIKARWRLNIDDESEDRQICQKISELLMTMWEAEQIFYEFCLDDMALPKHIQDQRQDLLNSDPLNKIQSSYKYFPYWLLTGIHHGSYEIIALLHQISPGILNDRQEAHQAYEMLFINLHHFCKSQDKKEELEKLIMIADFCYENSLYYREIVQENVTEHLKTTLSKRVNILHLALNNHHLSVLKMFLRQGTTMDCVLSQNNECTVTLGQYIELSVHDKRLILEPEALEYLSLHIPLRLNSPQAFDPIQTQDWLKLMQNILSSRNVMAVVVMGCLAVLLCSIVPDTLFSSSDDSMKSRFSP